MASVTRHRMLSSLTDKLLTSFSARKRKKTPNAGLPTRDIETSVGSVRVFDSGSTKPCVVFVPDGPNVIEHYDVLIDLLSKNFRVVCFDMPGFGFSLPQSSYGHSLDQGAKVVLGVLESLGIKRATLAFSCANGFYALRAAQLAPQRIANLVLSQTPSLTAMLAWRDRVIPPALRIPIVGQIVAWLFRRRAARRWYQFALPRTTSPERFQQKALDALSDGGCFCLAGVVQALSREKKTALTGLTTPCTMVWGAKDRSHRHTDPLSLHALVPNAEIVRFDDCGHFPDVEQPGRFAVLLVEQVTRYA